MNTNKFLIGGIIGGIANFLLGWLVWGMLLMNFMKEHTSDVGKAAQRSEENMIWWALIAGNLLIGLLLSYVINKAGAKTVSAGAGIGAVVGLLVSAAYDCMFYAMMDMGDMTSMLVDVLASMVVSAIVGAIIGWYLGMGKKAA